MIQNFYKKLPPIITPTARTRPNLDDVRQINDTSIKVAPYRRNIVQTTVHVLSNQNDSCPPSIYDKRADLNLLGDTLRDIVSKFRLIGVFKNITYATRGLIPITYTVRPHSTCARGTGTIVRLLLRNQKRIDWYFVCLRCMYTLHNPLKCDASLDDVIHEVQPGT